MLNIALFGPPGAGKGTQSKRLIEKYNLGYIATGDILREEIAKETELGKMSKDLIENGLLVSDEIIVQIIEKRIKKSSGLNGILFDGFPRTVVQAYMLSGLLLKLNTSLRCMLSIDVPKEELIKRMILRGKVSNRADDEHSVILHRLKEYEDKTAPVADFYKEQYKYYQVNGFGSVDNVFKLLDKKVVESLKDEWLNVVLSGGPGAGKGTQSEFLVKKYKLVLIASGKMFRREIREGSDFGLKAKDYIERGDLVPDELVIKMIEKKIKMNPKARGFLFDGFPVNMVQAYILDGLLRRLGSSITCMINLKVPHLVAMKRLLVHGQSSHKGSYNAKVDIVINRLEKYDMTSGLVNKYYKSSNKYSSINAVGDPKEIFKNISGIIENSIKNIR